MCLWSPRYKSNQAAAYNRSGAGSAYQNPTYDGAQGGQGGRAPQNQSHPNQRAPQQQQQRAPQQQQQQQQQQRAVHNFSMNDDDDQADA